jgi:hypothetical protein
MMFTDSVLADGLLPKNLRTGEAPVRNPKAHGYSHQFTCQTTV